MAEPLLRPNALEGACVGVSVSDSPDLAQLGLDEFHLRLTLGEVARTVMMSSGTLLYGGHLDPAGYTAFLQSEVEKHARRDQPLVVCLAWQEHRERPLSELRDAETALGLFGRIVYLDPDGQEIAAELGRDEAPEAVDDSSLRARALTGLRAYMTSLADARLVVGGRRSGFQGRMPGVVEETLLAVRAGQPVYVAGGFGGAAADIAHRLGRWPDAWPALGDGMAAPGLDELSQAVSERGWPENGLSRDDELRLAASHRPSDIASLVALGLGRTRGR